MIYTYNTYHTFPVQIPCYHTLAEKKEATAAQRLSKARGVPWVGQHRSQQGGDTKTTHIGLIVIYSDL